jgi:hypothetical protein
MEPDFFAEGFGVPKRARAARSPMARFALLIGIALIGFAATSAAMRFGPDAIDYVRELASAVANKAPKFSGPRELKPLPLPEFKPAFDFSKIQAIPPPSFPQFTIPRGNRMPFPSPGG